MQGLVFCSLWPQGLGPIHHHQPLLMQAIRAALHWTPPPTDIPESKPFYRNLPESKTPSCLLTEARPLSRNTNRLPGTFPEPPAPSRNPNRLPGTFPEPLAPSRNLNRPPGISLKDSNCKQRQGSHQAKQEGKIASASLPACQWEGPCQFMGRPKFSCDLSVAFLESPQ